MGTKFENIQDTELIEEIMSGFSQKVRKHLEREHFIGYKMTNINKKVVIEVLKNPELKDSLFYYDCGYKVLTEEVLDSDEFKSIYMRRKSLITGVYITTYEAFKYVLNQINK